MWKRSIFGSVDYKMSLKFVVFACLIFKVSALDITCPDHVETMPNFNPALYVGDWYGTFATYNSYLDETSTCIRASYGELSTVVCKIVHKFASVWCKTALGEVGVSLP